MDVFLSYRRDDSHYITDRVYDWLTRARVRYHVFKDVDSIPLGRDFHQAIREAVGRCDVLLAVIGPGWLTAAQAHEMRRIDDPDDFVRMELEAALERDIPIVPLLVNNATMPTAEDLPPSLRPLAYRNGMPVRPDPDFRRDMERLIAALPKTRSPLPRRLPARRWLLGGAGVAALTLLCTILAITSGRVPSGGQRAVTKPPGGPAGPSPSEAEVAGPKPRPTYVPVVTSVPTVVSSPTAVPSPTIAGEADDLPPRVKVLVAALQDQNADVREGAANSLRKLGARAKGAVPALVKRVTDEQAGYRNSSTNAIDDKDAALAALKTLAPERVEQALIDAGKAKNPDVKMWANSRLGELDDAQP